MIPIIPLPPEYESFTDLLMDVHIKYYLISVFFTLVPLILIIFISKPILNKPLSLITDAISGTMGWVRNRKTHKKIRFEYDIFSEREASPVPSIILFGIMAIIVVAIITHTFYFALVISNSMQPLYGKGDIIFIESVTLDNLSVGDIVVAKPPGVNYKLVHRIHEIRDNGVIKTKGDNVPLPDWWELRAEHIEGKVVMYDNAPIVIRGFGIYFMPIKTPYLEKDPAFMGIRNLVGSIHEYGQIVIMFIVILIIITMIKDE